MTRRDEKQRRKKLAAAEASRRKTIADKERKRLALARAEARRRFDEASLCLVIDPPLWRALQSCEVFCVSLCCGPDAYDLSPKYMREWVAEPTIDEIHTAIRQIDELIARAKVYDGPVQISDVAGIKDRETAIEWLSDVKSCILIGN